MSLATTEVLHDAITPLPVPLLLVMMDVLQARGRREAVVRLVDELYARGSASPVQASR